MSALMIEGKGDRPIQIKASVILELTPASVRVDYMTPSISAYPQTQSVTISKLASFVNADNDYSVEIWT